MKLTKEQKLNIYEQFKVLDNFKNPEIKYIVEEIVKHTPTIFFGASTSSTGKWHPEATNGLMGLVKHSIAVMLTAQDLMRNETIMQAFGLTNLTEDEKEIILAACLLHDNAKYGSEDNAGEEIKVRTQQAHPRLIIDIADNAGLDKLTGHSKITLIAILDLIETHMGQWTNVKDEEDLPKPASKPQRFVHTCDYIASRKTFDIVNELSFPFELINPELNDWFKSLVSN